MASVDGSAERQLTDFADGRFLWPSISANGSTVAFERDFEIWTYDVATGAQRRLDINLMGSIEGPAREIGFVNFPMSGFGVVSPRLRALAQEPVFPDVKVDPDSSGKEARGGSLISWKDAQLSQPRGEALSAYGVSLDATGVAMVRVPEFSEAWGLGFRSGDFITEVDGQKVEDVDHFLRLMKKPVRKKVEITLIRNQQELKIHMQ